MFIFQIFALIRLLYLALLLCQFCKSHHLNNMKLHKCFHIISCSQLFSSTVLKLSCTTLAPYCWCAKVSSFQQVWKAKRWESKCMKVMLSAKPFLLLSYTRPPLLCTILMHSGIKSKSIFNQVMASKLFWFKNLKKTARVLNILGYTRSLLSTNL